jgi:hypothetical protein
VCGRILAVEPTAPEVRLTRGLALARLGRVDEARQELLKSAGEAKHGPALYDLARGFSLCASGAKTPAERDRDVGSAIEALKTLVRRGEVWREKLLGESDFDAVREAEGFKTLLASLTPAGGSDGRTKEAVGHDPE